MRIFVTAALALYFVLTLPVALLIVQDSYFRSITIRESARKLGHLRRVPRVMLGDSLTAAGGNWERRLGGSFFDVVNQASPGATIRQVTGQLDSIAHLKPQTICVLAGTNDFLMERTDEQILADFATLLADLPRCGADRFVVTSIPFQADPKHDTRLLPLNQKLQVMVTAKDGIYLDLNQAIATSPARASLFQKDGIHFSERMYELWASALRRRLQ